MPKVAKIACWISVVISFAMLWGAFSSAQNARRLIDEGIRVSGEVTENIREESQETVRDSNGRDRKVMRVYFYPVIQFVQVNGQTQVFKSSSGSGSPEYAVGQQVPVIYLASDPADARIESTGNVWGLAIALGVMGGLFLLIPGGVLFWDHRKSSMQRVLLQTGRRVEATIAQVIEDTSIKVNGRFPYRVLAQWQDPASGKLHLFKSNALWFDPSPHLRSDKLGVFIEPNNPKRYAVDPASLPQA